MIEYSIEDINGNILALNDSSISNPTAGSVSLGESNYTFENRIVENSSLPGAVQLGKRRLQSKEETINFSRANPTESTFRASENELIRFLEAAKYLIDNTNQRRALVSVMDYNISFDSGSYALSSDNEITFKFLETFWKDVNATTESDSLAIDINTIAIVNSGFLKVPPILIITAAVAVTQLQIYLDESKIGLQIDDDLFGTTGYEILVIDCGKGTVVLGSLDRINSVLDGTGPFQFPVGSSDLVIIPTAECDIVVSWNERFYL